MDVAIVLLLPLIGGYWVTILWDVAKYKAAREHGYRLYFRSITYAIALFTIAFFFRAILKHIGCINYQGFEDFIHKLIIPYLKEKNGAYKVPILLTSVYAVNFGWILPLALNKFFPSWKGKAIENAIKDNDFERLIVDALTRFIPVCITMDNKKVYVGYVVTTTDPTIERKAISILPLMSGYLNVKKEIEFTTFYTPVYEELRNNVNKYQVNSPNDFEKVLPTSQIQSVNMFDVKIYEHFQNQKNKQS